MNSRKILHKSPTKVYISSDYDHKYLINMELSKLSHSAAGLEILMALITMSSLIFAVTFTFFHFKSSKTVGSFRASKITSRFLPFWWSISVYFITQAITAQSDNLGIIGLGFAAVIATTYSYTNIVTVHTGKVYSVKQIALAKLSAFSFAGIIYYFNFDYINLSGLYNSRFTSFTFPIAVIACLPFFSSSYRLIKKELSENKQLPLNQLFFFMCCFICTMYFPFFRANPWHTNIGYGLTFLLFCCVSVNVFDIFIGELKNAEKRKQFSFSTFDLLNLSHDQGKKLNNINYLLQDYIADPTEKNLTSIKRSISILADVSDTLASISFKAKHNIKKIEDDYDRLTVKDIHDSILKEYENKAARKGMRLEVTRDPFLSENVIFLVNRSFIIDSIINNLVDNSVKAGVADDIVRVNLSSFQKKYLRIDIIDTCGGISPEIIQEARNQDISRKAFNSFKKLKSVGQGLTSVFHHVDFIGAEINYKGSEMGSTFSITLFNTPTILPHLFDSIEH